MTAAERFRRTVRQGLKLLGLLLVALALIAPVLSAEIRFVLRAAYEEARILLQRRPIVALAARSDVPPARRAKLYMVLDLRRYADSALNLNTAGTFTTFADVGRDTLLLVLSASPREALRPYLWRFPIVGAVPYHGYFSLGAALAAAADLERRGFDTHLRPAGAFSTLGWFSDPLLSTVVDGDTVQLAATVLHEVAHTTLYVPSATPFDESFASFVGYRGAEEFFRSAGEDRAADRAAAIWRDEIRLSGWYGDLVGSLTALYDQRPRPPDLDRRREALFREASERARDSLGLEAYDPGRFAARPLNNATIVAGRIYRTRLELFEALYQRSDRSVARAVRALRDALEHRGAIDPYVTLEREVGNRPRQR